MTVVRPSEALCEAKHAARAKLQFAQIRPTDDGCPHGWATVDMREVAEMTTEGDWEIRHVWMTRDEFEALPDFGGW